MTDEKRDQGQEPEAGEAPPEAEAEEMKAAAEAAKAAEEAAAAAAEVAEPDVKGDAAEAADEPAGEAPKAEAASTAAAGRPDVGEMVSWTGHKLDEMNGATVGRVEGAYVDDASGQPEWLLVRLGRFGHHTLVPGRYAVAAAGRVWVPFARDVIRRAPRIKTGSSLTKDEESALLAHYGVAAPNGRSAEIAEREAGAVTARPAS
jgi:hypothetical protein